MQEGSLSLMQLAKISSVLYDYQSNKKLFYISILTSPSTDGVLSILHHGRKTRCLKISQGERNFTLSGSITTTNVKSRP